MLTDEQIKENKKLFLEILNSINVEGSDLEGLVKFLEESDFFTAPASTQYHCSFKGGLCQHSLNVYFELQELYDKYKLQKVVPEYSADSLKVVGLLHDISKVNFYESYVQNKKIYSDKGSKSDNLGKFDWFSEERFKVRDAEERFLASEHGVNSYIILSRYIPLTEEEMIAIMNHHCHTNDGNILQDQSAIMNKYPLLTMLHLADMASTFLYERI